jgi:hypothetical protein
MGDYSHLKNKKGELIAKPLPQPTLPNLSVDDDDSSSMKTRAPPPSTYTQDSYYYKGDNGLPSDYPLMPAYPYPNAPAYAQYNHSSATLSYEGAAYPPPQLGYDDDKESTIHLTAAAAPFAQDPIARHGSPYGPPQVGNYDAHQGRTGSAPPQLHRHSPPSSVGQPQGGMAYDDVPEYPGQYQQPAGMFAAPESFDGPYSGYASPPAPVSNQPSRQRSRGRNYDEETGYGSAQGHAL